MRTPRMINISKLAPQQKRDYWEQIKNKAPKLAIMLTEDQNLKSLVETFNADIKIERSAIDV